MSECPSSSLRVSMSTPSWWRLEFELWLEQHGDRLGFPVDVSPLSDCSFADAVARSGEKAQQRLFGQIRHAEQGGKLRFCVNGVLLIFVFLVHVWRPVFHPHPLFIRHILGDSH